MPKRVVCVFNGCKLSKGKHPDISFHRFPQEESIRMLWINRSGNASLALLTPKQMGNVRVCCTHFAKSDIISYGVNGKVTIRRGALPIIPSIVPTDQESNQKNVAIDEVTSENTTVANPVSRPLTTKRGKYTKLKDREFSPTERKLQRLVAGYRKEMVIKNQRIRRLQASLKKYKEKLAFLKPPKSVRKSQSLNNF